MSDSVEIIPQPVAVPAAEEPEPAAVEQDPPLVTAKKLKVEEKKSKCPRCKLHFWKIAMKKHACSPIRGELMQFAKDNHLGVRGMRIALGAWDKYRKKYPYPGSGIICDRCHIFMTNDMFVGHVCIPQEGMHINFFDCLMDKYHCKDRSIIKEIMEGIIKED